MLIVSASEVCSGAPINAFLMFAEITAFSDRYDEFEKLNTEILGVSIDSVVCCSALVLHAFINTTQCPVHCD